MPLNSPSNQELAMQEDMSDYVAHLQLHMSLQAKNLVPTFSQVIDSRQELLQQTQADFEKHVSRQKSRFSN